MSKISVFLVAAFICCLAVSALSAPLEELVDTNAVAEAPLRLKRGSRYLRPYGAHTQSLCIQKCRAIGNCNWRWYPTFRVCHCCVSG